MTLDQAHVNIGRKVEYTPFKDCSAKDLEYGVITGANNRVVFVRYGSDVNSKATSPEDIELTI